MYLPNLFEAALNAQIKDQQGVMISLLGQFAHVSLDLMLYAMCKSVVLSTHRGFKSMSQ